MKIVHLTHSYSTRRDFVCVETDLDEAALNEIIAYIQLVRGELPLMAIYTNDDLGEDECAIILERLFKCRMLTQGDHQPFDYEIDLFTNNTLLCEISWGGKLQELTERMPVTRSDLAKTIFDVLIEQAEAKFGQYKPNLPSPEQSILLGYLKALRNGEPALPEWKLKTIANENVVGVLV